MFRALQDEDRTITQLAEQLRISKQATLKIVDDMEGRDLVARHAVADDRRLKLILLTDRGRRAMETAVRINRQIEAAFAAQIGQEMAATIRAALRAFVDTHGGRDDARARRARPVW